MKRIVLTGGTGFVGRVIAARAAARWPGVRVVVPTRRLSAGRHLQTLPQVELVVGDVHDGAQMSALLQGADALVHCVAILHGTPAAFDRVHVQLPRTLAAACLAASGIDTLKVSDGTSFTGDTADIGGAIAMALPLTWLRSPGPV